MAATSEPSEFDVVRGRMLAAWRNERGLTQAELAAAVEGLQNATAVSMWESGRRGRDSRTAERLSNIETALEATPAFRGLWQAVGTPSAVAARGEWSKNYQRYGGPVWAWVRPGLGQRQVVADFWWGEPARGELVRECTDGGVFVHFPASVPNPPLRITLRDPGFVDFGEGVVPSAVVLALDAIEVAAVELHGVGASRSGSEEASGSLDGAQLQWLRKFVTRIGVQWNLIAPHLGVFRTDGPVHALDGAELADLGLEEGTTVHLYLSGPEIKAVREGRGLSRADAADKVRDLDGPPVTARMIELLETGAGLGREAGLLPRLDMVLGMDGRLGLEKTFDSRTGARGLPGAFIVKFPAYWVGPVWIRVAGPPGGVGVVVLTWYPWRRRQRVRSGIVVTTRRSAPGQNTLLVRVPPGWTVIAGTGAVPTATDINAGWFPASARAAARLLEHGFSVAGPAIAAARRDRSPAGRDLSGGDGFR